MLFIDLTKAKFSKGDTVKLINKSAPFKVIEVNTDESGKYVYRVKSLLEYIIDEDLIEIYSE